MNTSLKNRMARGFLPLVAWLAILVPLSACGDGAITNRPIAVTGVSLDPATLHENPGLDVSDGVLHEALPRFVHLEAVPGESLLPTDEDDIALGDDASGDRAIRLLGLVHVGLVGLDAHRAQPQIHEPPGREVPRCDLLV